MCRNSRSTFFVQRILKAESGEIWNGENFTGNKSIGSGIVIWWCHWETTSHRVLSRSLPPPTRCWGGHVLGTWRHGSAVTQPAVVDWHLDLNRKKLKSKILQLLFAFLPSFTNHFKYFIRKLKTTVYSVMSHVAPANFQALDQRVSWRF